MFLKTERGDDSGTYANFDTIDRSYEISAGMIRDMKLFAFVLAVQATPVQKLNPEEAGNRVCQSLIVTPTEAVESSATSFGVVKRVGMMHLMVENFGPNELNDSRATVTLV
jgi:hypothetical protein